MYLYLNTANNVYLYLKFRFEVAALCPSSKPGFSAEFWFWELESEAEFEFFANGDLFAPGMVIDAVAAWLAPPATARKI